MIWNTSQYKMNILVNNRISVVVNTGSSKIGGIGWRILALLLFVADGSSSVFWWCQPLLSFGASFSYIAKHSLSSFLCLASGLNHHCKQNGIKCYYVLTHENILLKHNMQEMRNWKRLNIEEIYSMIVEYVFAIIEHIFTLVKYNLI